MTVYPPLPDVAGLTIASVVADVSRAAQPALLYLVPCILIPMLVKATLQVDIKTSLAI